MKNLAIMLLFMFATNYIQAQHPETKRANIWYFGNGAGLDFSSGTAVAITNGQLDSWESCASISDINGNLLFYTDGDTIWDKNHNVMPNGTGLFGSCVPPGPNNSATQGVIIIPQPNSANIFYVFTVDCAENLGAKGMNYSIVDLNLNGGFGDVTVKDQFLFAPSTEAMAATMNCTRDSIWVVGHEYGTDAFYAYLITENGLNTTPVISNVGTPVMNYEGQMKFSPDGRRIAYNGILYDFNFNIAVINNELFINFGGYGLSFSLNSTRLYFCASGNLIGQYDITNSNAVDIINSYQTIYNGPDNSEYWGLQLSNDNKLYIAAIDTSKISRIDFPNNIGIAAGFNPYSVDLNGRESQFTFPSFIENYFDDSYNETNCYPIVDTSKQDTPTNDTLIIPNIFTPNNDGINDLFSIKLSGYEDVAWKIYNRWGSELKSGKIASSLAMTELELWDGRTNADTKVRDGTYYYIIHLTKKGGELETKKGFITLLN